MGNLPDRLKPIIDELNRLPLDEKVQALNELRFMLHQASPFKNEPVDCVIWQKLDNVQANDYNPNSVAPPEMRLLHLSVKEDHFTQPIVAWRNNGHYEIVDGFHRNLVGRKQDIKHRLGGYLPLTVVNQSRVDRGDRIASTIRHNRARGIHSVDNMSEIVVELSRRNWNDSKIAKELGMEPDEVLRLKQISGIAELFSDAEFSEAWEIE